MESNVIFGAFGKPLLLAHLGAAVVLIGASFHHFFLALNYLRGIPTKINAEKRYVKILFYSFLAAGALGMIVYPAFRVFVRADYFDASVRWATGLFEIKEWLVAVALATNLALFAVSRHFDPRESQWLKGHYFFLSAFNLAVVVYASIAGALLTMLRSV